MTEYIVLLFIFSFLGFGLSLIFKRNDIADPLWSLGFLLFGSYSFLKLESPQFISNIVFALLLIWSLRLSLYLFIRFFKHKNEDQRYVTMKNGWGNNVLINSYLKVFLLQAILMAMVAFPLTLGFNLNRASAHFLDFLGVSLVVIGFLFETIADWQLYQFKKNAKPSEILNTGVWSYTQHPNYFGEFLIWWGFYFLCAPHVWYTILSPLLISFLLIKVSGVGMKKQYMQKKGEAYIVYQKTTPEFFPFKAIRIYQFLGSIIATITLDALWLGGIFNKFYFNEAKHLTRNNLVTQSFDPLMWATVGVYIVIPLSIFIFATKDAISRSDAFFKGGIYGFLLYCVYEYTNLSLIAQWPINMALLDILWGTLLCGLVSFIIYRPVSQHK